MSERAGKAKRRLAFHFLPLALQSTLFMHEALNDWRQ